MSDQADNSNASKWAMVRDAGMAVGTAAANSKVGTSLARTLPKMKEMVSVGAGLAVAQKSAKLAVAAVRRNPVAALAGAAALAGVGVAVALVRQRKKAANGKAASKPATAKPTRLAATDMRKTAPAKATKAVKAVKAVTSTKPDGDSQRKPAAPRKRKPATARATKH